MHPQQAPYPQQRTYPQQRATAGPLSEFASGVGLFGRGLAIVLRSPGLLLLGMLPALIAFVLLLAVVIVVVVFLNTEASTLTWFANGWPAAWRAVIRVVAAIAILGVTGLLAIVAFTALTLLIGDPFYEKISQRVDDRFGGLPGAVELPWYREIAVGAGESVRLLAFSAVLGTVLFLAGFLPAIGQSVVPVAGAFTGGWALALELTALPFARRGLRLRDRRRLLRGHRFLTLGFGVAVFVCFLIPLGAVLLMPAAVAGATLLTRRATGETVS